MFSNRLRHFLLISAAVVVLAAPLSAAEQEKLNFDVPAQGLSKALESLASQSGLQMLYPADLVAGLRGQALRGDYTPEQALPLLLKGSGLVAKPTGPGSFTIVKAETPVVTRLDTIMVTATRTPNKTFDLPVSATTVTRDQIEDSQAPDLGTVMRQIPGVSFGGTPRESGQLPAIRGAYGPDIIMRVDDARRSLDASVGIYSPLMLDHNFIKQVDVVRGPSSALHGGGGLGGVMAFQTIDAEDIVAPGNIFGVRSKSGWRSGDGSLSENLTGAAKYANASILASGTLRNYHNVNNGAERENNQNGTTQNGLFKLGYAPNDLNALSLSYLRYSNVSTEPSNPSTNDDNIGSSNMRYRERSQDEVVGSWKFKDRDSSWFDGKVSAYFTDFKQDVQGRYRQGTNYDATFNVTTTGTSAQNSTRFSTFDMGHRLTYGVDGYQDLLKNTSAGVNNGVNPNGNMLAMGAFLQDEFQFAQDWLLIGTLRHDRYQAEATGYDANKNSRLSPKLALKWQALKPLGLFASYGEAFRAPTLTELFMANYQTSSFSQFRPNGTLDPEVSRNAEIGATLSFDSVLRPKDALRIKANRYDERVKNLISQTQVGTYARTAAPFGTGGIYQYQNVPHGQRTGAEIESTYQTRDVGFNLGYSRVRVTNTDNANSLYSPPDKFVFGANYYVDGYWSLRYSGTYVLSQQYDTTEGRRRKAYTVHDMGTAYDRDWYRLDFSVTNLFDRAYTTYNWSSLSTSQIYEEGRSFNMFFTAKF